MNFTNLSEEQKNISKDKKEKKKIFSILFSFFKRKKNKTINDSFENLDRKLVYSLSPKKIPNFRQLKYTKKVLGSKEKKILNVLIFLIIGSSIFLGIRFYKKHLVISPEFGGEYVEGLIGSPKNINPLYNSARDVDSDISRLIYSSLFKRDGSGNLANDLVENYSVSENGLEYVIKIKENVKWHHGEGLVSDDIVFTFEAIKNPDYGSPLRSTFSGVSISKIDEYSVKFVLTESYSSFLDLLTFGILPQNLWISISPQNAYLHELNIKPIGSGPYEFKSLVKNKSGDLKEFVLVANNEYFDQVPYIDKIILKFFSNYSELIAALNNNQVDGISYLPHSLKADLVSQNSLKFNRLNLPQITSIFLNKKTNSILDNKNIRQTLSKLIDKNKICDEIFSGNAGVAYSPILPNSPSYNDAIEKYDYNYEEANKSLDEAGWALLTITENELSLIKNVIDLEKQKKDLDNIKDQENGDEVVEEPQAEVDEGLTGDVVDNNILLDELNKKNEELKLVDKWEVKKHIVEKLSLSDEENLGSWRFKKSSDKDKVYDFLTINLTTVDLVDNIMVAEFIKNSWGRAGVKTFVKVINPNQVQSDIIRQKNFEALLLSQVVGGDQDNYAFWHSSQIGENGLNISEYKNKEVDKLLEEARVSLNQEEKIEKYKKFQETLNSDFPVIFLYFPTYTYTQNKKIKGFDFENILNPADRFNNVSRWYIKVNRKIKF
ncbi:MAG TPA: peptide ABC transporter substrate-binding protein [bacterium]|nr:peptide ABC transporter substrate-binding protein [bacterium]